MFSLTNDNVKSNQHREDRGRKSKCFGHLHALTTLTSILTRLEQRCTSSVHIVLASNTSHHATIHPDSPCTQTVVFNRQF
jgi:hypothetical protein